MYISTAFSFFILGGIFALFIRTELAVPGVQFLNPETYNQLFTIHGTTMIFLFVMPMMDGPGELHRAAPDRRRGHGVPAHQRAVASGWSRSAACCSTPVTPSAARPNAGWTGYAPLSDTGRRRPRPVGDGAGAARHQLRPRRDQLHRHDLQDAGARHDADAHAAVRVEHARHSVLLLFAVPVLTAGLMMLFIDRNYGGGFFDPARAAIPSSGSTCSGSSATPRCTSSSCRRSAS